MQLLLEYVIPGHSDWLVVRVCEDWTDQSAEVRQRWLVRIDGDDFQFVLCLLMCRVYVVRNLFPRLKRCGPLMEDALMNLLAIEALITGC